VSTQIRHADLWGRRNAKEAALNASDVATTEWREVEPRPPFYLFVPRDYGLEAEYNAGWRITDAMPLNGVGMTTARDRIVIDFEREPILNRAQVFRDSPLGDREVCARLGIPLKKGWDIRGARMLLRDVKELSVHIERVLYRPFDVRLIFYHPSLVWRTVERVMRHIAGEKNLGICIGRAGQVVGSPHWDLVYCTREMTEFNLYRRGGNNLSPLYLYPERAEPLEPVNEWPRLADEKRNRAANFHPDFIEALEEKLGLCWTAQPHGDLQETFGPEDVFHYIYAVLHSPTYRKRYADFLRIDFPRIPITSDLELFRTLCAKGAQLVALHLMESPLLQHRITDFPIRGDNTVEKGHPRYLAPGEAEPGTGNPLAAGRVYISKDNPKEGRRGQYFEGVPPEVWEFHVGGYQVCEKWLKDRRGRQLSYDDIEHYHRIVVALKETIRLMGEIDEAVPAWPIQ